jgi:endonuclease/exonuclease/phosphatase family metal-dependent hydrolase
MLAPALALALALAAPALAAAVDVPVGGRKLALGARSDPGRRTATVLVRDAALVPPFPDPRLGASLVMNGGAGPGQCRVEIALDPAGWRAVGDGGWRYSADAPGTMGVRRVVLRRGLLSVKARGAAWPCDLAAAAERVPVSVVLRADTVRYCAAFGGDVRRNGPGRFTARDASAPAACPKTDLTVADLNILHGLFCPAGTASCRLAERIDLLFQWVAAAGCPDVVTLQEVTDAAAPLITAHLATACPFPYELAYQRTFGLDDEMILTRHPVAAFESYRLYPGFRHVSYARLDHPLGPIDVFSTHLASSSDGAQQPCATDCPPECVAAGAATVRDCQAVQMAQFIAARHDVPAPAVATGDFNESPGTFVHQQFTSRGWLDTYLAAGNPECDPLTGIGCTSGREDEVLDDLESPASNEVERIDYAFLIPPAAGSLCAASLDPVTDADGDGTATRIFADDPNPFAPACGPAPEPICWPSDHEGAELDLNCG